MDGLVHPELTFHQLTYGKNSSQWTLAVVSTVATVTHDHMMSFLLGSYNQ